VWGSLALVYRTVRSLRAVYGIRQRYELKESGTFRESLLEHSIKDLHDGTNYISNEDWI
jgi:hypothetical protein